MNLKYITIMMLPLDNLTPLQLKVLSIYPTYQKFMIDFKPIQLLVQYDDVNTIEQSLSNQRMTIGDICMIYPTDKTNASVDYIREWLSALNRTLNINKPLTDLDPIAYMLYKDHKYLYLTDFKIIFERIVRGDYGMFYGSVDAQLILKSFVNYTGEWKSIKKKITFENRTCVKTEIPKKSELDIYLDKVENDIRYDVSCIMRENHRNLTGYDYLSKKESLISERLDKELPIAKEEFIKEHVSAITQLS
jgi:hypothetical protein